jgi:hypothetical protein
MIRKVKTDEFTSRIYQIYAESKCSIEGIGEKFIHAAYKPHDE